MKIVSRIALISGFAGILLLITFSLIDMISIPSLVANGIVVSSLLVAGIALFSIENTSGLAKYVGISASLTGFLVLTAAAYQFIELNSSWHIGVSLLAIALITVISRNFGDFRSPGLKWTGFVTTTLSLIVVGGILCKVENPLFFIFGAAVFSLFSIISVAASFQRKTTI